MTGISIVINRLNEIAVGLDEIDKPLSAGEVRYAAALLAAPAALPDGYVMVPAPEGMKSVLETIGKRLWAQLAGRFFCANPVQFTDNERQVMLIALHALNAALLAAAQEERE